MEIIAISLIGLYLLFKLGLIDLITNTIGSVNNVAQTHTELWEEKIHEKTSRDYGKLQSKYEDSSIARGSKKTVSSARKQMEADLLEAMESSNG